MRWRYFILAGILLKLCHAGDEGNETDGDTSRKILGSSVVTSVSVVMDTGNTKNTIYTDAVGKPQSKPSNPSELASPIDLLNPDRYEFYTFDDNGDLVKRLMSLEEIKSIIATGDSDALDLDSFTSQGFLPEKRVSDVVSNVQNVLKEEMEILKDPISKPIFDTPDVSDSWSMILPAIFGNSGEDIKPERPVGYVTPETIMVEPNSQITQSTSGPEKIDLLLSSIATTRRPYVSLSTKRPSTITTPSATHISQPVYYSSSPVHTTKTVSTTTSAPALNVEIISNGDSTTDNQPAEESNIEVKPDAEDGTIPTRAPVLSQTVTNPPLIRNRTQTTSVTPTTQMTSETILSVSESLTSGDKPQTVTILSSSVKPTTQKTSSTNQQIPIRTSSAKPITIQWTSTSFRPTPTQLSSTSYQTSSRPSSTPKPTRSPTPNIFGLPSILDTRIKPISGQLSDTPNTSTSKPVPNIFGLAASLLQENNPTSTFVSSSTYSMPIKTTSNIFGFPMDTQTQKPNPITLVSSYTSSIPVKTTSTIGTTTSKISIKPQLITTSTIGNVYPSSSVTRTPLTSPVAPLKISTTSINEDLLPSTEKYIEMKPSTWAPSLEDAQLFSIFKEVLSQNSTTTEDSKQSSAANTEYFVTDTTSIKDALNFESNRIQTTVLNEDLNTLHTENIQQRFPTTTDIDDEDATTKLPTLLNSLNDNQKVSASELLDQLLLTTNIYEINTELASTKANNSDLDVNANFSTTLAVEDSEQQTTTEHDIISYPPTTDFTIIQSIEQLLSQAVGDVQTILNQTTESTKHLVQSSTSETVFDKETETQASDISTSSLEPEVLTTTVNNINDGVTYTGNDNLNDAVEALLSQVNDNTASLNRIILTENPISGVTNRKVDENEATYTTSKSTMEMSIVTSESTPLYQQELQTNITEKSQIEDNQAEQEATTFYYIVKKNPKTTTTEEPPVHLINITVLSFDQTKNRTKPAKADLSLEQELIAEELKNLTLLLNVNETNPTELLKESETKVVLVNPHSVVSNQIFDITEETDRITNPTTPQIPLNADTTILAEGNDATTEQYITTTYGTETTTNELRFAVEDQETTEIDTTENTRNEISSQSSTAQYSQTVKSVPKPSILITINNKNTTVTENGKLVVNKTVFTPAPAVTVLKEEIPSTSSPLKQEKNSTQDQTWTLVSTVAPQHAAEQNLPPPTVPYPEVIDTPVPVDLVPKPMQGFGLEESTSTLDVDVHQFAQLCNELAFEFWKTVTTGLSSARSIFVSPFAVTSMLAMVFLGAKGATSEEMNKILKLDDMVTFNPHLTFKSVSESVVSEPNSGIATTAMIRELFSDRSKGKLLDFYKNRVRAFYDGFVEEVSYREIGDVIRRRSNLLVKKYSNGKYTQFFNDASIVARSPLSGVSINIFETDCSQTSSEGRDGELHFIVHPSIKQRRLVPIPAVVYRSGFVAGYEPSLDATAVALGNKDQVVSTILVIPGQQGIAAPGDGLARLEKRLVESSFKKGAWSRLLRSLIPRPGLEVQIPRFSHRSVINTTTTLQRMKLSELFDPQKADLRGLNGVANELHLSDMLQVNKFATCGEKRSDETHHSEVYPATTMRGRAARRIYHFTTLDQDEPRDYQRAFPDPLHDPLLFEVPLSLRPRQARIPDVPRLRFDRPFLYFVRHNPTGLILHMGRFNPRLLP